MRKLVSKIKNFFSPSNDCGDEHICFEWSEEENSQYEKFAVEHFEECGIPTPWLCFKYANGKWVKKMVCPACKTEYTIIKK